MGQLNGSVAANAGARGDTIEHGALGGADQRAGTGREVVLIEVDHADESVADLTVALAALDVDEGVLERLEDALFEVLAHRGVDVGDELVDVGGLQVGLGQDEAQGGRRVADGLLHTLPVLGLRSELVACDDRPLAHIDILGQQNVGRIEAKLGKLFVHGDSSRYCLIKGRETLSGAIVSDKLYKGHRKKAMEKVKKCLKTLYCNGTMAVFACLTNAVQRDILTNNAKNKEFR